jgi:hypothetical protein
MASSPAFHAPLDPARPFLHPTPTSLRSKPMAYRMLDPISEARIRTQGYWYRDGLEEIVLGMIFLLNSTWVLSTNRVAWFLPYMLLIVAFAILVPRIKTAIRERLTYRRSGYVGLSPSRRKHRVAYAIVFAAVVTTTLLALTGIAPAYIVRACMDPVRIGRWLPTVGGILIGGTSVYVWARHGLQRWIVVGAFTIILGIATSILYPLRSATGIFLAGAGCAFLCSGGVTLWRYAQSPPAVEEA